MKKVCLILTCLSLQLLLPGVLPAQQNHDQDLPDPELIEFLGTFNDRDAGWVDPQDLLDMEDTDLKTAEQQEEGDEN